MDAMRLQDMREELATLEAMSEDEACALYNTDSKAEYAQSIKEWYYYEFAESDNYRAFLYEIGELKVFNLNLV